MVLPQLSVAGEFRGGRGGRNFKSVCSTLNRKELQGQVEVSARSEYYWHGVLLEYTGTQNLRTRKGKVKKGCLEMV